MNPIVMQMLERFLGKDKVQGLMQQWNNMTPQQQQSEMQKVMSMSNAEKQQYLSQKGIDMNQLTGSNQTNNRFNY